MVKENIKDIKTGYIYVPVISKIWSYIDQLKL